MFSHRKNESGYALVTVLLLIVIFMIVSLFFMQNVLNTTNQSTVVERKMQSADLAEMGVQLYKTALENEYSRIVKQQEVMSETMEIDDFEQIKEEMIHNVHNDLSESITNGKEADDLYKLRNNIKYQGEYEQMGFEIMEINEPQFVGNKTEITFQSRGFTPEEETTITSNLSFGYAPLLTFEEGSSGEPSEGENKPNITVPDIEEYIDCGDSVDFKSKDCYYDDDLKLSQSRNNEFQFLDTNIFVDGDFEFPNYNNEEFNNTTFYVIDDFKSGNLNGSTDLTVYANGDITIDKNLNNAENMLICAGGTVSYNNAGPDVSIFSYLEEPEAFQSGGACESMASEHEGIIHLEWDMPEIIDENYIY